MRRSRHSGREGEFVDEMMAQLWGVDTCDLCGRTIILGEDTSLLQREGQVFEVCSACESSLSSLSFGWDAGRPEEGDSEHRGRRRRGEDADEDRITEGEVA